MVKYNSVVSRDVIILLFENDSGLIKGLCYLDIFLEIEARVLRFLFFILADLSINERCFQMLRGCRENDILQREE